eukprot:CAMPEP_0174715774 /NCGR_PEP_ID=MMETSP1094-20130205/22376_1 /TAXON_ID=156173 /ORGANISM="Chrysochromulina brevifilum, Strain UTEX LB 985" /LENGTH=173 /DNA_ID=CAMNT_0015915413 /DNA_START=397 /DNA_END=920 /DNA_ORIENTATION=+
MMLDLSCDDEPEAIGQPISTAVVEGPLAWDDPAALATLARDKVLAANCPKRRSGSCAKKRRRVRSQRAAMEKRGPRSRFSGRAQRSPCPAASRAGYELQGVSKSHVGAQRETQAPRWEEAATAGRGRNGVRFNAARWRAEADARIARSRFAAAEKAKGVAHTRGARLPAILGR